MALIISTKFTYKKKRDGNYKIKIKLSRATLTCIEILFQLLYAILSGIISKTITHRANRSRQIKISVEIGEQ